MFKKYLLVFGVVCLPSLVDASPEQQLPQQRAVVNRIVKAGMNPIKRALFSNKKSEEYTRKKDVKKFNKLLDISNGNLEEWLSQELNKLGKKSGNTLLHRAIARQDFDLAESLVQHGADPLLENSKGISSFELANQLNVWESFSDTLKRAFEKGKIKHWIRVLPAQGKASELAQKLNQEVGISGSPLLHQAVAERDFDFTRLLIKHGSDPLKVNADGVSVVELIHQLDLWDSFPEVLKVAFDRKIVHQLIKNREAGLDSLKFHSMLSGSIGLFRDTFLHRSLVRGDDEFTQLLIGLGANLLKKDRGGLSALDLAIVMNVWARFSNSLSSAFDREIVRQLLESNFNPISLDVLEKLNQPKLNSGDTLLHRAIVRDDVEFVRELIEKGADPFIANSKGFSPLGLAVQLGKWQRYPKSLKTAFRARAPELAQDKNEAEFLVLSLHPEEVMQLINGWIQDRTLISSLFKMSLAQSIPNGFMRESILEYASKNASDRVLYSLIQSGFANENEYEIDFGRLLIKGADDSRIGLPEEIKATLHKAIQRRLSRLQVAQISQLIEVLIPYANSAEDIALLRQFINSTPFVGEGPPQKCVQIYEKIETIEKLNYFSGILKEFLNQNRADEDLKKIYDYLLQFTAKVIKNKINDPVVKNETTKKLDETLDCSLCYTGMEEEGVNLGCGHSYHLECIMRGIKVYLEQEDLGALTSCHHEGCTHKISPTELASIVSDFRQVIAIQRIFIRSLGTLMFCPSCGDGVAKKNEFLGYAYTCQKCKKDLCFSCGRPPHYEISCAELNTDDGVKKVFLREILENGESDAFGLCPCCNALIERLDGCDDMTCGENAKDKPALDRDINGSNRGRGCGRKFDWEEERVRIEEALAKEGNGIPRGSQQKQRHHEDRSTDSESTDSNWIDRNDSPVHSPRDGGFQTFLCIFSGCQYEAQSEEELYQHILEMHPEGNSYDSDDSY